MSYQADPAALAAAITSTPMNVQPEQWADAVWAKSDIASARQQAESVPAQTAEDTVPATRSRCWDGSPETDADRRFFDLRESGYTGAIDQDGYPVADPFAHAGGDAASWSPALLDDETDEV